MDSKSILWIVFLLGLVALSIAQQPLQIEVERGAAFHRKGLGLNSISSEDNKILSQPKFRLPDSLTPISYKVEVITVLEDPPAGSSFLPFTAPGAVKIAFKCQSDTNLITLSANDIAVDVNSVRLYDGAVPVPAKDPVVDDALQFLNISLTAGSLLAGREYVLQMTYTAQIAADVTGLYRADYKDEKGVQKWIATTQFETLGFRKMAPGFDEPKFKAVFTISVCRPKTLNSLSNTVINAADPGTDLIRTDCPADYEWDHYTPTSIMSTYLIALVVSEFDCEKADEAIFGKPVGICGPKHLIAKGGGVLGATQSARLLKAFQDIFGAGLEYPMPKMDSVAIPRNYFQFGAMENWGLNTYKDNLLLFYNGESQESNRYQISNILSHELAHQWFGNLVTCNYWSHIWLNEGFATYLSYRGMAETMPEYEAREQFFYDAVHEALLYDVTSGSHPVINTALPEEVEEMTIFDTISYEKGGSLIRMMEGFLGEETLFKGLRLYLAAMKYKPSLQENLFEYLGQAATADSKLPAGVSLEDIMNTWTLQRGFPLVRVAVDNASRVYISQERFRNNAHTTKELDPDDLWEVPIAVATQAKPDFKDHSPKMWLQKNVALRPYNHDTSTWLIVNPEGYGFYRVLYDTELTVLIQNQLDTNHTVISPLSKSQLINDYFNLFDQGYVQVETALAMTKFLKTESSHIVWTPTLASLSKFQTHFSSYPAAFAALKGYLVPRLESALDAIKWTQGENEHGVNLIQRVSLLDWACALDSSKCKESSRTLFDEWKTKNVSIPLDLQPVVYCTGVSNGSRADFDFVLNAFEKVKAQESLAGASDATTTQINRLLTALTCTKDVERGIWLVRNSMESQFKQYASLILQSLVKNPIHRATTIGVVRTEWKRLITATGSHQVVANVISTSSNYESTTADLQKHIALETDVILKDQAAFNLLRPTFGQVRIKIASNMAWVSANLAFSQKWLETNSN